MPSPDHIAAQNHRPNAPAPSGASKDIEEFIYLISHDVRASVRALLELPQWISEDLQEAGFDLDGPVGQSIDLMNRHTGRLDRMLVDLLAFSRVGRLQDVRSNWLEPCLDRVIDELDLPSEVEIIKDMKCAQVVMGERDILTLFSALLSNAVKHHDRKKIRILVSARQESDGELVLSVADDGPGIPEAHRQRVFGAMVTLKPRDEVEGSGMGLALVQKIAQLNGGRVQILPSPFGRGCSVELRLPQGSTKAACSN